MLISPPAPKTTILGLSSAAIAHTGTTNETTLVTLTIPGGTLGANGLVRLTWMWSYTNSANNKILRAKLGATAFLEQTLTTTATVHSMAICRNANSQTAQKFFVITGTVGFGTSASAIATGAIDTTANVNLTITAQLASGAETATLESYLVELIVP